MTTPTVHDVDRFRNLLAFLLIGAFIVVVPLFVFKNIPTENKEIIVYMVGQMSGMAATALAFYFTQKAGQEALDTERAKTTGKMAEAITAASMTTPAASTPTKVAIEQDPDNPVPVKEAKP